MILTILLSITGVLGLAQAYMLGSGRAQPGGRWGYTALGGAFLGAGFTLGALSRGLGVQGTADDAVGYLVVVLVGVAIALEYRGRRAHERVKDGSSRSAARPSSGAGT